jgi:putative protease
MPFFKTKNKLKRLGIKTVSFLLDIFYESANIFLLLFREVMYTAEKLIGIITHFFPRISVAVVEPKETIKVGDQIRIRGKSNLSTSKPRIDFIQTVESMEIDHEQIREAKPGDPIGLQVTEKVCEGCEVFKL